MIYLCCRYVSESTDTEVPAKKSKDSDCIKKPERLEKLNLSDQNGKPTIKTPRAVKKNESKLELKRKIDLNPIDDFLPPPKLEPELYPDDEEGDGDGDGSSGAESDGSDYEFEETETYTLTEWFPPDFWRSKLDSAKQVSLSKLTECKAENIGESEDDEEYYYHLLKAKMSEAEKVVVTDVTANNSSVSFKVFYFLICETLTLMIFFPGDFFFTTGVVPMSGPKCISVCIFVSQTTN